MERGGDRIRELEIMLERGLYEAKNSPLEKVEVFINRIRELQMQYEKLTGKKYQFNER